jgi:hypothetical protein
MIAEKIFRGLPAEDLGLSASAYASRKAALDRYLQHSGGGFDPADYLAWLPTDQAGSRGAQRPAPTRQPVRIVGGPPAKAKRSCCGGGKIR